MTQAGASHSGDRKLSRDIVWTAGSFFILAASGIAINVAIAVLRDPSALGIFNLSYAVYIIASQFAAAGVHYSVLRSSAHYSDDAETRRRLLWTGASLALALGLLVGAAIWLAAPLFGQLFNSAASGRAIAWVGLGLTLFPLNKVLISYINGMRHMRAFSVLQAARYILVMAWVVGVALSDLAFEAASLAFFAAELVTVIAALLYLGRAGLLGRYTFDRAWLTQHVRFGLKSLPSGMFLEINTRVDVLIIGIFLSEREVGIYSFAAMLADGLYHMLAMVRVNVNPILVAARRDQAWEQSLRLMRLSRRGMLPLVSLASLLIGAGYFIAVEHILVKPELLEGLVPLAILLGGLTLISTFVPFDNLLMVSGFPGYQTLQNFVVVVTNIVLNIILIPQLGIAGAALGTAASYMVGLIVLFSMSRRLVGWNLLTNKMAG